MKGIVLIVRAISGEIYNGWAISSRFYGWRLTRPALSVGSERWLNERKERTLKYSYSYDEEENFTGECDSIEAAILDSIANYGGEYETVFIGEVSKKTIGGYLSQCEVENLLERMQEQASEECGEAAEDWLSGPYFEHSVKGESKEDRQARYEVYKQAKNDWLAFLLDGFRIVMETWATEEKEQPRFWHIDNVREYDCKTMKLVESI